MASARFYSVTMENIMELDSIFSYVVNIEYHR